MAKRHLIRPLLEALGSGSPGSALAVMRQLLDHLLELCPECREELESLTRAQRAADDEVAYQAAVTQGLSAVHGRSCQLDAHADAARDHALLMRLDPEARLLRVRRALTRFRSPLLVGRLLAESARQATADPVAALGLAECAHAVALRLRDEDCGSAWCMSEIARANAYRGNALRAAGDYQAAAPLLEMAEALFAEQGTGDPLVHAELSALLGSLRKDQGRFAEAEALLDSSIEVYRAAGEQVALARELITKGTLLNSGLGETERAVAVVEEALTLLDAEREPRLFLCAHHNLLLYLHELGRDEEAGEKLAASDPLYRRFPDPWTQLRRAWLAGKIAFSLGRLDEAAATLDGVRQGFAERGLGFDAALAGLDLALVHLERGESRRIGELAADMVATFLAQDVRREAVATLILFDEAARREAVTRTMIAELGRCLEQARQTPRERPS